MPVVHCHEHTPVANLETLLLKSASAEAAVLAIPFFKDFLVPFGPFFVFVGMLVIVGAGNAVNITVDTLPDRIFAGVIAYVAPTLSVTTRTALARVALDNADRALRGNMYGQGEIAVSGALPTVIVPATAVQRAKGVDLVFVRLAEDEFEARRVQVRSRAGEEVRLAGGVLPGETVVTLGSFLLKTETLKDSIGAGCCDVE